MIKTRIAGAAATLAISLAALGGAVVAVAAPASAAPDGSGTTSSAAASQAATEKDLQADMSMIANTLDKVDRTYGTIARTGG